MLGLLSRVDGVVDLLDQAPALRDPVLPGGCLEAVDGVVQVLLRRHGRPPLLQPGRRARVQGGIRQQPEQQRWRQQQDDWS